MDVLNGIFLAKNYKVLKLEARNFNLVTNFIIAKNYRVLKPQQRS